MEAIDARLWRSDDEDEELHFYEAGRDRYLFAVNPNLWTAEEVFAICHSHKWELNLRDTGRIRRLCRAS